MPDDQTWVCDRCDTVVGIGQFPICHGDPAAHGPWRGAEEPMEAQISEHLTSEPGGIEFTSIREKVRYMDRKAIEPLDFKDGNDLSRVARGPSGRALFFDMGSGR